MIVNIMRRIVRVAHPSRVLAMVSHYRGLVCTRSYPSALPVLAQTFRIPDKRNSP